MASSILDDEVHKLSPDIYELNDYVNKVKQEFIPDVNEDTLMLGIFGYFGQIQSEMLQNTVVMASEFSNESIPTRAKFEKNIIAHALELGVVDINAVPARMEVFLVFLESDIINWYKNYETQNVSTSIDNDIPWEFKYDKDTKIFFGEFEFHTDYDILIRKVRVKTEGFKKRFAYTAQYYQNDFEIKNPISNITNPYLNPPQKINYEGDNVIYVRTIIRQVERSTPVKKRVLLDNDISTKTITFTYDGQLAGFTVDVTESDGEFYRMTPVYEGLITDVNGYYCWYTYLNTNTIRVKFDSNCRVPATNANMKNMITGIIR